MVDGGVDPKKKGKEGGSSKLNLDIYDPLYLHPQEIGSQLITFKLEGTENYEVWSAAVQLALHTRNKIGFINGKCIREENVGPLQDQWDRQFDALIDLPDCTCAAAQKVKDHSQILRLMQFLMGLNDVYSSVRSLILTTEPLPDLRSAFATLSRDESHRNSGSSSLLRLDLLPLLLDLVMGIIGILIKLADQSKSVPNILTNDQYQRLMALLSDTGNTSKTHASIADFLYDIIDLTGLNLTVSHPNRTVEHVKCIGSYKLANDLIIKDVLVVLGYHDLTQSYLIGTGSEKGGLYFLDEVCHKAKQTREPFPLSVHKTKRLGDLVHLDVWGLYRVRSREGFKYFLTVVDDFTRAVWVFLMQSKSENGVAERNHKHLLNTARALMFLGGLPLNMWPESVLTATYLINRLPTVVLSEYVFEENGINDLNFFTETNDNSLRSNDPYDDGGDNADNGNKSAPKGSVNSPNDSTVGDASKEQSHVQTENTDTINGNKSAPKGRDWLLQHALEHVSVQAPSVVVPIGNQSQGYMEPVVYTKIMAALAIVISSDSLNESVGSPPSRVILFGDIPTVIPSTSIVAPETSTIAPVISSAAPSG
ncbi:ribonuclease H-like domain-containing protein [Tanacetum coccineum]